MGWKIFLVIFFVILIFITAFLLWVVVKIGGLTTNMEEQLDLEKKLRNGKK